MHKQRFVNKTSHGTGNRCLDANKAGSEEMTSTKTFVATALVMAIMGWNLAGKWGKEKIDEVQAMVNNFEEFLQSSDLWIKQVIEFLGDFCFLQIIGRGPSYSAALQGALMFKEAARNPAEGILGGEFRHGPMEMVKEGFKAVVYAPQGKTFEQSFKMAEDIASYNGKVVLITNSVNKINHKNIHNLQIPATNEDLFPILGIIPLQFIVNKFALNKDIDPGHFIRGSKVTTIE